MCHMRVSGQLCAGPDVSRRQHPLRVVFSMEAVFNIRVNDDRSADCMQHAATRSVRSEALAEQIITPAGSINITHIHISSWQVDTVSKQESDTVSFQLLVISQ